MTHSESWQTDSGCHRERIMYGKKWQTDGKRISKPMRCDSSSTNTISNTISSSSKSFYGCVILITMRNVTRASARTTGRASR